MHYGILGFDIRCMRNGRIKLVAALVSLGVSLVFKGCGPDEEKKPGVAEQAEEAKQPEEAEKTEKTEKAEKVEKVGRPQEKEPPEKIDYSQLKPNPSTDFKWEVNGNLVTIIKCKASGAVVIPEKIVGFPVGRIGGLNSNGNTLPNQFKEANAIPNGVTSLVVADSLQRIGDGAFYGCKSLSALTIPNKTTSIGRYAFYGCENLRKVTVGNGLSIIAEGAFYNCRRLTNPTLPDSLTQIGHKAFQYCTSLTEWFTTDKSNAFDIAG